MKSPLVSIIVVNWNGGEVFEECLESLRKISYSNWELIVVDNGSVDRTQKYATIKNKSNLGFAPANNQGFKVSKGKYILLLNNDTLVEKDFLSILVKKMEEENDLGVIQPKIKLIDRPGHLDNCGSYLTRIGFLYHVGFMKKDTSEFNVEKDVFSVKGACMLIRRKIIEEIGLFDDDFFSYFEESDFCWRVWLMGYRCIYFPKTFIFHRLGFTIKRLNVSEINWHYYKNRIMSLIKNLSNTKLLTVLPVHLIISAGISSAFFVRGQFRSSYMVWRAIWWNALNMKSTIQKRRKIQNLRIVEDSLIFSRLSVPVDWNSFFNDFKRVEKDIKDK